METATMENIETRIQVLGAESLGITLSDTFVGNTPSAIEVSAGKHVRLLTVVVGSVDIESIARLSGDAAVYRHDIVYLTGGTDAVNINMISRHAALHTQATMVVHGVATGRSRVSFTGNIFIEQGGKHTEGHLEHEGLLMSRGARISSLPGFEIHTDDVKAMHSSAVHFVRPEQLFFLQTRGISETEARHMIIEGFVKDMLTDIRDEAQHAQLEAVLDAKLATLNLTASV